MISFFVALVVLIVGYVIYGSLVEKLFRPSDRPTPAIANPDGVDYVPISTGKAFLIQLLNTPLRLSSPGPSMMTLTSSGRGAASSAAASTAPVFSVPKNSRSGW